MSDAKVSPCSAVWTSLLPCSWQGRGANRLVSSVDITTAWQGIGANRLVSSVNITTAWQGRGQTDWSAV